MSSITLYPLGDYNNGILSAFSIDLDGLTKEEYQQEVARGLYEKSKTGNVTSTKCLDCGFVHIGTIDAECGECGSGNIETKTTNEEWIVCDSEDVPRMYVGEYDLDDDFFEYNELLTSSYLGKEIVDAGVKLDIPLEDMEDRYVGSYKDDEDFAHEYAEMCGDIDDNAKWPHTCIDWEQAARELMQDFNEQDGHYFSVQ